MRSKASSVTWAEGVAWAQLSGSSSWPSLRASSMNPATGMLTPSTAANSASPRVRPGQPPARSKSAKVAGEGAKVLVSC